MAEAPVLLGGVQLTLAAALPAEPVTAVGISGTESPGITGWDGSEAEPAPFVLLAVTVNV